MTIGAGRRPGWLYWVIAVLALAWNGFACFDWAMTVSRNPGWMAQVPPETVDWLDGAPWWSILTWGMGVWGGAVGALCLLLRSRWAVAAFAASLIGLALNQVWQATSDMPGGMASPGALALSAVIWIVALGLLWQAWRKFREGVLR